MKHQKDNSISIEPCFKLTVCCKDIDAWAWYSCSPSYTMITKICHYSSYMPWNDHWYTLSTLIENNKKYMYHIAWNQHVLIEYLQLQITIKCMVYKIAQREFASTRHNILLKFIRNFGAMTLTFPLISTTSCSSTSFFSNSVRDFTISPPTPESMPVFLFW